MLFVYSYRNGDIEQDHSRIVTFHHMGLFSRHLFHLATPLRPCRWPPSKSFVRPILFYSCSLWIIVHEGALSSSGPQDKVQGKVTFFFHKYTTNETLQCFETACQPPLNFTLLSFESAPPSHIPIERMIVWPIRCGLQSFSWAVSWSASFTWIKINAL